MEFWFHSVAQTKARLARRSKELHGVFFKVAGSISEKLRCVFASWRAFLCELCFFCGKIFFTTKDQ